MSSFKKALGFNVPRVGRWVVKVGLEKGLAKAEMTGWIVAGKHDPEPAWFPSLLSGGAAAAEGLPSARYGGLLRIGQTPNGEYWGADLHRKSMPVYLLDASIDGVRAGWRRRFDRLDDFVFFATKAGLCQRDRITIEEFVDLARERNVRPEELVPDSLEDEREAMARLGLRRSKRIAPIANRFLWLDLLTLDSATPPEFVARVWADTLQLHALNEDKDDFSNPSVGAFWLLRHGLFGDEAGYQKAWKRTKPVRGEVHLLADAEARSWWDKKKSRIPRAAVAAAIEARVAKLTAKSSKSDSRRRR
ncbi:MAG: hypothetical protein U0165_08360 [Polyangiaceae bacterium]